MRLFSIAAGLMLLTACATNDPNRPGGFDRPPPGTNFGSRPNIEADVRAHFEAILIDPMSAQYRIGYEGQAHCNVGRARGGSVTWYGYAANIYVNAKNQLGGYTGFKPYTLLWNPNGSFSRRIDDDDFGNWAKLPGLCRWMNGETEMAQ
jgi:hypothetical protein